MNREGKLVKNTVIYMVGNVLSKMISFFMFPILTFFLGASDLGMFDLIFNSSTVVIPIITLCSAQAVIRFVIDETDSNQINAHLTNGLFIVGLGVVVASIPYILLTAIYHFDNSVLIFLFILSFTISTFWQELARALHENIVFAMSGVIQTLVAFVICLLFILLYELSLQTLLVSYILASVAVTFYIEWKLKIVKRLKWQSIDFKKLKAMVSFSIPLIPNSISWWATSGVSRYIISFSLGVGANGIFAMATKFPALLMMANNVFNLAWTESAIVEYKSEDKNAYYTNVFNHLMRVQFTLFLVALPLLKYLLMYMVEPSFYIAWLYVPLLLLSTVFSSFASFYGTGYLSSNNTRGAFSTVAVAAIVNIMLTVTLIQWMGLHAAAVANCVSMICLWLTRIVGTRKFYVIQIDKKMLAFYLILSAVYSALYYQNDPRLDAAMFIVAIGIGYYTNKQFLHTAMLKVQQKLLHKKPVKQSRL